MAFLDPHRIPWCHLAYEEGRMASHHLRAAEAVPVPSPCYYALSFLHYSPTSVDKFS